MIIENLTRFLPACSLDKVPMPTMIQTLDEDSYVRFLDAKDASSNSLQQLKAEIAALANDLNSYNENDLTLQFLSTLVTKLRQLSAV